MEVIMNLHELKDEDKIKAFDMIVDKYNKESDLSQFGGDVQDILNFLKDMNKWNKK
jgi:hypothetical protein